MNGELMPCLLIDLIVGPQVFTLTSAIAGEFGMTVTTLKKPAVVAKIAIAREPLRKSIGAPSDDIRAQ